MKSWQKFTTSNLFYCSGVQPQKIYIMYASTSKLTDYMVQFVQACANYDKFNEWHTYGELADVWWDQRQIRSGFSKAKTYEHWAPHINHVLHSPDGCSITHNPLLGSTRVKKYIHIRMYCLEMVCV